MAAKTKCPACGAKNDAANHRCRICTAVINPGAVAPVAEEPVMPLGIDHFDAGDIERQIRPARERFGSSGSGLTARLSAARRGPDEPAIVDRTTDLELPPAAGLGHPGPRPSAVPTAALVEHEDEPFDPDALFRDMG